MTWSIVAREPDSGLIGIAVASKFFAVGALCPFAAAGVGGLCSQALPNPLWGRRGLALLREGLPAEVVRDLVTAGDPGREQRQFHVVDNQGHAAAHTGRDCIEWCGHASDTNVSVAGNMLAGPEVVAQTLASYLGNGQLPIVERLLTAMEAGEAAGGDKRGKQSAGLIVQGQEAYRLLDLRADDHADPLAELRRLYAVAQERFIPFTAGMPRAARPFGLLDRDALETIIEREIGKPLRADMFEPEA